jgi:hypothetical protein
LMSSATFPNIQTIPLVFDKQENLRYSQYISGLPNPRT